MRRVSFFLIAPLFSLSCGGLGSRLPDGFPRDLLINQLEINDGGVLPNVAANVLLMMVPGELFDSYEWNRDQERILSYYRTRGFAHVTMTTAEAIRGENGIGIFYTIDPGHPVLIRSISIRGSGVIEASALMEILGMSLGDRMDTYALEHGKHRITTVLESEGYVYTDTRASTIVEGSRATLDILIDEGKPAYVGEVSFAGLDRIRETIAHRYVAVEPGRKLLPRDVQRTQRHLLSTGLFSSVRILVPGMERGEDTLSVFIRVREAPPRFVEAGLGYVYPGRMASSMAVGHQNVGGMAASLRLDGGIEGGWVANRWQRTGTTSLSYFEPWFRELPFGAGSTIDYKRKAESTSSYQSIGASLEAGRSWYDIASAFVRYKYRYRDTQITGADTTDFLREEIERPITNSVEGTITLDSRNSFSEPTAGHLARIQITHAGDFLGGDWSFREFFADWSSYRAVGPVIVALRARAGLIRPLGESPTAPDEVRFRAGGANTVRGFEEEGLGPKDSAGHPLGGEALSLGNLEARISLRDPVTCAAFVDCGQVWQEARQVRVADLEPAVGIGIRYGTIIGPVRVDWGIPVRNDRRGRLYLTLGHAF